MDTFHWVDYLVLTVVLVGSLLVGVFFACHGKGQNTTGEYFQGNRRLSLIPTALSTMASYISGILILGFPAEIFLYGGMLLVSLPGVALGAVLAAVFFIPLFYPLKLTSINVYLQMRFRSVVPKYLCTVFGIFYCVVYSGLVIYAPATTISIVTGIPIWAVIVVSSIVVVIYTSIGGIKAVIWTDAFQAVCMTAGMAAIAIQGIRLSGGFAKTFEYASEGGRLNLINFDPDPRVRQTFWTMFTNSIWWTFMIYGATQTPLQRYCGMESLQRSWLLMFFVVVFLCIIKLTTIMAGFGMYGYYSKKGCDPLSAGEITSPNQLVPYFVMETLNYPGIPGLFVSAMCAGGLSSASSVLNAASANTWVDFLQPKLQQFKKYYSTKYDTLIVKLLVVLYGAMALAAAFLVSNVGGTITQLALSFNGSIMNVCTGTILFACLCPWFNWKGATAGGICCFIVNMWLCMGSYSIKQYDTDMLPLMDTHCPVANSTLDAWTNSTLAYTTAAVEEVVEEEMGWLHTLYTVNYSWYQVYGYIVIAVVGTVISLLTRDKTSEPTDPSLMFHAVSYAMKRWYWQPERKVQPIEHSNGKVDEKEAEAAVSTSLI